MKSTITQKSQAEKISRYARFSRIKPTYRSGKYGTGYVALGKQWIIT
ncbi:hypothetical protein [Algoriphagus sp.]